MINVRVLFFGATADTVGSRAIMIPTVDNATPADVVQHLVVKHPQLGSRRLLFAVNEKHADATTQLKDGDDLAIFTPVSGG